MLGKGNAFLCKLTAMPEPCKIPIEFFIAESLQLNPGLGVHGRLTTLLNTTIEWDGYRS
tara:strand:+ start:480 stop:656 length:177 start_codon:yes stop_codon:yes gene_type:complete